MMNTKIYKAVYILAEELLEANNRGNQEAFDALYAELQAICTDNENTDNDHPVQWETLADFTEELDEAIVGYEKALEKAIAINSKDFMSSIAFSMAVLQVELGQNDAAISNLQNAKISSNKIEDKELKNEIHELLAQLLED
ncbi:tetratricopeptide repeat protein [Psychrobacter frigidicola]|uniref:Tetratricopeptide repeat protein n=1 Tax=Psychrobacter frigidicola TaxID=45611 RepID=A0A5C7A393_9GAMM|nr:tetratricopeptide repeat protein [Psychrobacter frigidicola]TXD97861.1 tetratricopeptide repeat protein [Psychrobacter frigidicola]